MVVLFFSREENFYKEEWLHNSEGEGGLKGDGKNHFFWSNNRFFFYTDNKTKNCPRHESFFVFDMSFKFDTTMIPWSKISFLILKVQFRGTTASKKNYCKLSEWISISDWQ